MQPLSLMHHKQSVRLQTPCVLLTQPAALAHAASRPFCRKSSSQHRSLRVFASAWGMPEPFAAPQLQQPSLSSIADMQRQIDQQFDSMLSPFSSIRQMEQRMDQQFLEMDRQFDRAFADMDRAQRQLDAELARSLRQLQEQEPGVRIERREERAPGTYRYYESIQVRTGSSMAVLSPTHSTAPVFSPLLFVTVLAAGAYAAVTAAFNRNYGHTTYKQQGKWQLLLLWPVLVMFSKNFRQQFTNALKGEKVKVLESMDDSQRL